MMKKYKVFISSVQSEFAEERQALLDFFRTDILLKDFFTPYIFENTPATSQTPETVFLGRVKNSDIYIALIGEKYGNVSPGKLSPTEMEYDKAKASFVPRWVFIKDAKQREEQTLKFIAKIESDVSRKKFSGIESLKKAVYSSSVLFLKQNGQIESSGFDESLHPYASIENISPLKIQTFIRDARYKRNFPLKENAGVEETLQHLRMMRNDKVVNSALLVFSDDPQSFFPTATVKCAHFHGLSVQKPIPDYKEFGGTVYEMTHDAVDFVLSKISISTGTRQKSNQVETVYEVPRAVIAEAIINAVAHRNYYSKGSIQVSVFKNRIEIQNPGKLPTELSLRDLSKPHGSYPHNPLLANCLFLTGDIERYGTGTLEIYELTKEKGLKSPVFSLNEGFKVVLWRPSSVTAHDTAHDAAHDAAHDVEYLGIENLAHRVVWVLKGEMSRAELMNILELKHRQNFTALYLKPALQNNLIEMTKPDRPRSKKQKYRLTSEGQILKKRLTNENK